jgi:hypothetical protein
MLRSITLPLRQSPPNQSPAIGRRSLWPPLRSRIEDEPVSLYPPSDTSRGTGKPTARESLWRFEPYSVALP